MISRKKIVVFAILLGFFLILLSLSLPKQYLIVDDFENNNISKWNESAFNTVNYSSYFIPPNNTVAKVILDLNKKNVTYGSFQRTINQNWSGFENGYITYKIKFDSPSNSVYKVTLSFGDVVTGEVYKDKVDFYHFPKSSSWQKLSYNLNNPDKKNGNLNFNNVRKIRLNIELKESSIFEKETTNVYIDELMLVKPNYLSKPLLLLGILFLFLVFIFRIKIVYKQIKSYGFKNILFFLLMNLSIILLISSLILIIIRDLNIPYLPTFNNSFLLLFISTLIFLIILLSNLGIRDNNKPLLFSDFLFFYFLTMISVVLLFFKIKLFENNPFLLSLFFTILIFSLFVLQKKFK